MDATIVPSLGWTPRSAAVNFVLAMEDHRKQAGLRLVQLREARGWNQEDLAHAAGVSVKTVSRFENGRHDGRRKTIEKLTEALEISEEALMGRSAPPAAFDGESQLDRLEARLDAMAEAMEELRKELSARGEVSALPEMPAELAQPDQAPPPSDEPGQPPQNGQAPADEQDAD